MSVRHGREFLSIPGPTTVPDEVLNAMHAPAVDIYAGPLLATTESCLSDLRRIFATDGKTYIYAANGHGAWEAAICNVFSRGDKVLALESGAFAVGWGQMASAVGVETEILPGDWRKSVDPQALEDRLRADTKGEIKAVLVVQVDTASGVVNDIPALRRSIDVVGHDALFMVDAIASLGTMPFEMDDWGIDVAVTGSQKGLMTPPGLSFNAANEKAKQRHEHAGLRTFYWDWTGREGAEHYQKYCGTPPEHQLFGLRKAMDMLLEEGLENVFERHRILAEATRAAVEVWAEGGAVEFNITEPHARSNSVTTVRVNEGFDIPAFTGYCREKCGVTLGVGISGLSGLAFRIAHMGHVNAPMVLGTLGVIETAFAALGVKHGRGGIQAAVDVLSRNVTP